MVTIKTWLDANANGVHDEGESSLPNVCVGYAYSLDDLIRQTGFPCTSRDKTDSEGIGGSDFLPGATGTIYKYTFRPEGYQPTTNMVSIDYSPEFGFVQQGVKLSLKVETVEDYIHNEFIKRWVRYIAFAFFILMIAMYATIRIEKQFFTIESVK